MASKPSFVRTWATSLASLVSQPSATKAAAGFAGNEEPPAQLLNALFNHAGAWFQYLSDGLFSGNIIVNPGYVQADDFKTNADETYVISAGDAVTTATGPTWAANGNGWTIGTSSGRLVYPVSCKLGDWIRSITVAAQKTVAGTITAQLYKYNANTITETTFGVAASYPSTSGYDELTQTLSDDGTAQAGGANTITLRAGASSANDNYKNCAVSIISGTGAGQTRTISGYVGATKIATVSSNWTTPPDATSVYSIGVDTSNGQEMFYIVAMGAGMSSGAAFYHALWTRKRP